MVADRRVSRYKLMLVRVRSLIRLISRRQSAIRCFTSQSILNSRCLIDGRKCGIGAIPIGGTMYRQRILLRHIRYCVLCRRVGQRCWFTPRNVCTHVVILGKNREVARMVVTAYTNWITGEKVCLCPGESSLHPLRMTSRGCGPGVWNVVHHSFLQCWAPWPYPAIYALKQSIPTLL